MKKCKIFICLLLVFLLSLSLFGLTASADAPVLIIDYRDDPAPNAEVALVLFSANAQNAQHMEDLNRFPYVYWFSVCYKPANNSANGRSLLLFGIGDRTPIKVVDGVPFVSSESDYVLFLRSSFLNTETFWNFDASYPNMIRKSPITTNNGTLYYYQFVNNSSSSMIPFNQTSPLSVTGAQNPLPMVSNFTWLAPYNMGGLFQSYYGIHDLEFYNSINDSQPIASMPSLTVGTKFGHITWYDENGNPITTHGGGGGSFNGDISDVVSWDSGLGGILKNIIVCFRAPPSAAEPISITMWGHSYTILSPTFFESSAWGLARIVIIASMSITVIVFLKNMVLKTISAQGNGDGE